MSFSCLFMFVVTSLIFPFKMSISSLKLCFSSVNFFTCYNKQNFLWRIIYQFVPIPQKLISIHLPLCYWYKRSPGLIQRDAVINEPFKRDKFQQIQQELVICFHTLFSSSFLRPLPGVVLVCVGEELCKRVSNISFCLWSLTVSSYVKHKTVYVTKRRVYWYTGSRLQRVRLLRAPS